LKKKKYSLLESQYFPNLEYFVLLTSQKNILINNSSLYKKQTYRNRCVILGPNGKINLSVPIITSKNVKIMKDMRIDYSENWINIHSRSLQSVYGKAPFFLYYQDEIINCLNIKHKFLIDLNHDLLTLFSDFLDFENDFRYIDEKQSKSYLKDDYSDIVDPKISYKVRNIYFPITYKHVFGKEFVPNLSIMDLLFSEGPNSSEIINKSRIIENNNPI